ncbi:MAG: SGNH/GDSL hydrolase family protein [Acidobacteriota bacterium]|jgi:lysophospholipase L1-like esterase
MERSSERPVVHDRRSRTRLRIVLAVLLALACGLQAWLWIGYSVRRSNVIDGDPAWRVMKEEVIYHPSAWKDFLYAPIGADGVELWKGQGFQGLRWLEGEGRDVRRVRAEVELGVEGSYVLLLFRMQEGGAYALRLSTHAAHPSGFFLFSPDWQAHAFEPLAEDAPLEVGRPVQVELELDGQEFTALVDGREVGRFSDGRFASGTVGLKGGFLPTRVREIRIEGVEADGSPFVWRDEFRHGSPGGAWALALALGAVLLVLGAVALVRWRGEPVPARFLASGLFLVVATALPLFLSLLTDEIYPALASLAALVLGAALLSIRWWPDAPGGAGRRRWLGAALFLVPAVVAGWIAVGPGALAVAPSGPSAEETGSPAPLAVGRPVELGSEPLGDQTVRLRARLAERSLLEVRFWSPELRPELEYRCAGRWHSFLLSTVPEVPSGFYSYGAEVLRLGSVRTDALPAPGRRTELELRTEGRRLRAYADGELIGEATARERGTGASGLYLFAGEAEVDGVRVTGAEAGSRGLRIEGRYLWSVALLLLGVALLIGAGRRVPAALALGLLAAVPAFAVLAATDVLEPVFHLGEQEIRVAIWAALCAQVFALLVALSVLRLDSSSWKRQAVAVILAVLSLGVTYFGSWTDPFRVVQLEMQAEVPPTPFRWLWYRHPSFRACNGFVLSQHFGGRRERPTPPPDRVRVMTLGASQTLGFGASAVEHTYPRQLEVALNRAAGPEPGYEVINAGVPGSYTLTGQSYFDGLLSDYGPEVVVINYCAADYAYLTLLSLDRFEPNAMVERIERQGYDPGPIERWSNNVRFWRGYQLALQGEEPDFEWVRETYEHNLAALIRSASDGGARVFVLLEPKTLEASHPRLDHARLYDAARAVAAREGAVVIDPEPAVAWAEQSGIAWWDYAHMTDFGYRVLAGTVARAIRQAEGAS